MLGNGGPWGKGKYYPGFELWENCSYINNTISRDSLLMTVIWLHVSKIKESFIRLSRKASPNLTGKTLSVWDVVPTQRSHPRVSHFMLLSGTRGTQRHFLLHAAFRDTRGCGDGHGLAQPPVWHLASFFRMGFFVTALSLSRDY